MDKQNISPDDLLVATFAQSPTTNSLFAVAVAAVYGPEFIPLTAGIGTSIQDSTVKSVEEGYLQNRDTFLKSLQK